MHWAQINQPSSPDEKITMLNILFMLVVDGFIFMIITWYVEAVNSSGEGVPQKPWFFVLPSYWFPQCVKQNTEFNGSDEDILHELRTKIEKDTISKPSIRIVNLTKMYGTGFLKQLIGCNFVSFQVCGSK